MTERTPFILLLLHFLLWSVTISTASADECIQPTLANGHIVGDGDDRSWTGTFHCDPGYILVGSTRLKCRYGQWSSNFPVCSAIASCDPSELPKIENGRAEAYKAQKFRGSVYKYSCNRDYERWGHSLVHCVGRTWDLGRVPICHVNTCSQAGMTELMGGSVVKKARGGIYFYHCTAPGAVMEGSSTLVCTEHGWNDTLPQCFFGPSSVTVSGPDRVTSGETVTYHCEAGEANPGLDISWSLTNHDGTSADHLLKIAEFKKSKTEEGWTSVSVAEISVPQKETILGLHISCVAKNSETGASQRQDKTVSVYFGPADLSIQGPTTGNTGDTVSVTCHTSPSVPPAQVSWIVSPSVQHLESSETIHQEEDGSFTTMSMMTLYIPHMETVEDVVVECVANHETNRDTNIVAAHIIKVPEPSTTTDKISMVSTTSTKEKIDDTGAAFNDAVFDYNDEEEDDDEDYLYFEHNEIDSSHTVEKVDIPFELQIDAHEQIADVIDTEDVIDNDNVDGVISDYHKYNVETEPRANVTHILMNNLDDRNITEIDADMSNQRDGKILQPDTKHVKTEDENNYVIFSKSETSDPKSYSSLKLDTATMTESSKKKEKSDNNENETVPIKASIIMSSAPNTLVSVLSVMLPLLSCLMLQKF